MYFKLVIRNQMIMKKFKNTEIRFKLFDDIFTNPRIITNYNLRFEVLFVYCMKNV